MSLLRGIEHSLDPKREVTEVEKALLAYLKALKAGK